MSRPADVGAPVPDVVAAARACKARDYTQEGIPMFLVLEDLAGEEPPGRPTPEGEALSRLAEDYLGRLVPDPAQASPRAVATALEILAAHHFDPAR